MRKRAKTLPVPSKSEENELWRPFSDLLSAFRSRGEATSFNLNKAKEEVTEIKHEKEECCFICMKSGKELVPLPCERCKVNVVHLSCIFEWKEQGEKTEGCPLCRGPLQEINFTPPDLLSKKAISADESLRKIFNLSPVKPKTGMIRCYLIVKNNPYWGYPYLFHFYLQEVGVKKYPFGPLPSAKSPIEGDLLLMTAKKRSNSMFQSVIDVFMEGTSVGTVEASSFTGLEYSVSAKLFTSSSKKTSSFCVSPKSAQISSSDVEVCAVQYCQNRFGPESGPRKMKVCFPKAEKAEKSFVEKMILGTSSQRPEEKAKVPIKEKEATTSLGANDLLLGNIEDFSDDEEDEDQHFVSFNLNKTESLAKGLRNQNTDFEVGENKKPCWLESIQAFSLDFNGRVISPSNKNFQIEHNDNIILQFGKVVSAAKCTENVSVYTVDFRFPLSPLQALGICLSSCDRKLGCA